METEKESTLRGAHVLISGASRGLGRSIAMRLGREGAMLSLMARNLSELEKVKALIGPNCRVYGVDITDNESIGKALDYFRLEHGQVDVLINNAGSGSYTHFGELSADEIDQTYAVNVTAVARLIHALLPDLKQSPDARILNVASDLARRPLAKMAAYSSAKHAATGLSHSLARELKEDGIRVMLLNPGVIDTWFGGSPKGQTPPPYGLNADHVADVVWYMLTRPAYLLMDEVSLHPMGQSDF